VTQTTYIPELQLGMYLQINNLALHLMLLQTRSRTVTWESLRDYVSIYSNRAKANEKQLIKLLMKFGQP
jgi:hypothetical protein